MSVLGLLSCYYQQHVKWLWFTTSEFEIVPSKQGSRNAVFTESIIVSNCTYLCTCTYVFCWYITSYFTFCMEKFFAFSGLAPS